MNSHHAMVHLPQTITEKKVKIIHLIRNPKDALVSYFFHVNSKRELLTFQELFDTYLTNNLSIPHQLDYLRQMQAWQRGNPEHPVMNMYYEDMKIRPLEVTQTLARFLGLDVTEQFCQEIVNACSFDQMKSDHDLKEHPDFLKSSSVPKNPGPKFYRKGQVGDWKNHLTVAQNERFDAFIQTESKGLDFTFTYI